MKISRFMQTILCGVGAGAAVTVFVSFFSEKIARIEFFQAMTVGMIFVGITSWLFFEKKIISSDIWVRRFFSIVFDYFIMTASMLFFDVITLTPQRLFVYIGAGLGIAFAVGTPLWYYADRAEKRCIEQINRKLSKNE